MKRSLIYIADVRGRKMWVKSFHCEDGLPVYDVRREVEFAEEYSDQEAELICEALKSSSAIAFGRVGSVEVDYTLKPVKKAKGAR